MELLCINSAEVIKILIAFLALVISGITVYVTWKQFCLYRERERSKVFSQLNERYLANKDVQLVVKYLSKTGPTTEVPTDYQTELFLRFFEEVGVYLQSRSIKPKPVEQLFGYYLKEIFTSAKGKELLKACKYKDSDWEYLVDFKNSMSKVNKEWSEIPIDMDFSN